MSKIHDANSMWNDTVPTREDLKDKVREKFARYGRSAAALILEFAKRPPWMFELFEKGGIPYAGKLEVQLENLARHLQRHPDPDAFVEFLRAEMALHLKPERKEDGVPPSSRRLGSREVPMLGSIPLEDLLPLTPATPAPMQAPEPQPPQPTAARQAAAPPMESAPELAAISANAEAPAGPIIDVPGYCGPDRRRGPAERRSFRDRRGRIDAIGKNRRFGGDRRKAPQGRRESSRDRADRA